MCSAFSIEIFKNFILYILSLTLFSNLFGFLFDLFMFRFSDGEFEIITAEYLYLRINLFFSEANEQVAERVYDFSIVLAVFVSVCNLQLYISEVLVMQLQLVFVII